MGLSNPSDNNQDNKSQARKQIEHKLKQGIAKKGRKIAGKALKKGAKLVAKAAIKAVAALTKVLVTGLLSIGTPVLLGIIAVVFIVILVSLVSSFIFGSGSDLDGDEQELYNYIVEQADKTVNMSDPLQAPYRVPEQLISSVIQIDAMMEENEKSVIRNMTESLAPDFTYDDSFNEWTQTQTQECIDDECEPWSEITQTDNYVSKLINVAFWEGFTDFTYTPYITAWKTDIETEIIIEIETVEETYTDYETVEETYIDYEIEEILVPRQEPYTVYENVPYRVAEYRTVIIPLDYPPYFIEHVETYWREVCCERKAVIKYREVVDVVQTTKAVEKTREVEVGVEKTREVEVEVEKEKKTKTKTRHQRFHMSEHTTKDYALFDNILNSYNLGLNDKRLIEINYMFQDEEIAYTDWLENTFGVGYYGGGFDGTIIPGAGVPAEYMQYYLAAEEEYGVDWYTLASIHFVETAFSTHPTMISSAGAIGHMQFMPATWVGWTFDIGGGLVHPDLDITNPSVIRQGSGYGVDANGDGKADPWDIEDAIFTAANYLAKNGYANDQRSAIYHYNHAEWYVNKVIEHANSYRTAAVYQPNDENIPPITAGHFMRPATGSITSNYGMRYHPIDRVYKMHHGIDIGLGGRSNVPIVAAADGVVTHAAPMGSYGNFVNLRHSIDGNQIETSYAHLANIAVHVGQTVMKGQFLGYMGSTGNVTGPHLHFEVHDPAWVSGQSNSINPGLYVPF